MLTGDRVVLAPIRERDLPAFYEAHVEIRNRGAFFPLGVLSESELRTRFAQHGFWQRDEGTLPFETATIGSSATSSSSSP